MSGCSPRAFWSLVYYMRQRNRNQLFESVSSTSSSYSNEIISENMNPGTSGGNTDERTPIDFMEALQIFVPRDKDISFLKSRRRELSEKAQINHKQKQEAEVEKKEREELLKVKRQQRE